MCLIESDFAGVAQLVRARGSYPRRPGFKSLHRHHFLATASYEWLVLAQLLSIEMTSRFRTTCYTTRIFLVEWWGT